jgi:hypothetical protein
MDKDSIRVERFARLGNKSSLSAKVNSISTPFRLKPKRKISGDFQGWHSDEYPQRGFEDCLVQPQFIFANIQRIAEKPGERIFVGIGAGHYLFWGTPQCHHPNTTWLRLLGI